jgi:hypothetical protein
MMHPPPSVGVVPRRNTGGLTRLSADVKSGLCKALKWDFGEGRAALYVPASAETKQLRDWLWKQKEPMAQYTARDGRIVGWQWALNLGEHRSVLRHAKEHP